jgi:hypothetical protein
MQNLEIDAGALIPAGCVVPGGDFGIQVSPNPATAFVAFDFVLPGGIYSAELVILDAQGKTIDRITLNGNRGQTILDTRHYSSGLYLFKSAENKKLKGKFIVR